MQSLRLSEVRPDEAIREIRPERLAAIQDLFKEADSLRPAVFLQLLASKIAGVLTTANAPFTFIVRREHGNGPFISIRAAKVMRGGTALKVEHGTGAEDARHLLDLIATSLGPVLGMGVAIAHRPNMQIANSPFLVFEVRPVGTTGLTDGAATRRSSNQANSLFSSLMGLGVRSWAAFSLQQFATHVEALHSGKQARGIAPVLSLPNFTTKERAQKIHQEVSAIIAAQYPSLEVLLKLVSIRYFSWVISVKKK
jgi:hypothetical protein